MAKVTQKKKIVKEVEKKEEEEVPKPTMEVDPIKEVPEEPATSMKEEGGEKKEEEQKVIYGFPYERLSPEELKRRREDGGESSDEEMKNTVGDVPMEWYEDFPHIGYDLDGKPIIKSANWDKYRDKIEEFLDAKDDPDHWRKFYDAKNDTEVRLTDDDLRVVGAIMGSHASRGTGDTAGPGGYGGTGDDQLDWPILPVDPIEASFPSGYVNVKKSDFRRRGRGEWRQTMHLLRLIQRGWINPATGESTGTEKKLQKAREQDPTKMYSYDLWDKPAKRRPLYIPPPPEMLPGHTASYNPPAEYLPTDEELAAAEALENKYERDDALAALAQKYPNLRSVPRYDRLLNDVYRRCLELYLCPRARPRRKRQSLINPDTPIEDIISQGPPPPPEELRPFPTTLSVVYKGHAPGSMVRACAPDAAGEWLASGSDSGELKFWEVATGRCVATVVFGPQTPVRAVAWCPVADRARVLAVAAGKKLYLIATSFLTGSRNPAGIKARKLLTVPPVDGAPGYVAPADRKQTKAVLASTKKAGVKPRFAKGDEDNEDEDEENSEEEEEEFEEEEESSEEEEGEENGKKEEGEAKKASRPVKGKKGTYKWRVPTKGEAAVFEKAFRRPINRAVGADAESEFAGEDLDVIVVNHWHSIALLRWHKGGDYLLAVTQRDVANPVDHTAVVVHRVSSRKSQRLHVSTRAGPVQAAAFHPTRPVIVVATQRTVRIYDVSANRTRSLIKKLEPNMRWVSTVAVHPSGDHILAGSYDKRLSWFDLDYSSKPYKIIRHHKRAVRRVAFHQNFPLFASCGDDGRVQILHATVSDEIDEFPVLVPLRTLHGHTVVDGFGILDVAFHPTLPWIFSSGADGLITMHTDKDVVSIETKRKMAESGEAGNAAAAGEEEEPGRFVVMDIEKKKKKNKKKKEEVKEEEEEVAEEDEDDGGEMPEEDFDDDDDDDE